MNKDNLAGPNTGLVPKRQKITLEVWADEGSTLYKALASANLEVAISYRREKDTVVLAPLERNINHTGPITRELECKSSRFMP